MPLFGAACFKRPARSRFATLVALLAAAGCGARSDLLMIPETETNADAGRSDVGPYDAGASLADATPPPDDAANAPPPPPGCDGGLTAIYLLTEENQLWSYGPATNSFSLVGPVGCPTPPSNRPNSMAVDRAGTAYAVFDDGSLFKIETANAGCVGTSYMPGQAGFVSFGMAFSSDANDPGETLFVAESDFNGPSHGLATIDPTTLKLTFVGAFSAPLARTELTGTSDGRLFAFSLDNPGPGSHLAEIDKTSARVLSDVPLSVGNANDGFAFAAWGGSFYLFTADPVSALTTVTRYDMATQTLTPINTHLGAVVGAGVSTCAPH